MDKKYTVFVSSTYEDLREERAEVMRALLECDCIPYGMELFSSANDDSWTVIQRAIEECDYYVLIVGGRYGSLADDGLSFTEKEFRYAEEIKKPILVFPHANPSSLPVSKSNSTDAERKKFKAFMELVNKRQRRTWNTDKELGAIVAQGIIRLKKDYPAVGWIRGDKPVGEELLIENRDLQEKNEELQKMIVRIKRKTALHSEREKKLVSIKYEMCLGRNSTERKQYAWIITWNKLLAHCFPNYEIRLHQSVIEENIKKSISNRHKDTIIALLWNPSLCDEMKNKIFFHFLSFGYITEVITDDANKLDPQWALTEKGRNILMKSYGVSKRMGTV